MLDWALGVRTHASQIIAASAAAFLAVALVILGTGEGRAAGDAQDGVVEEKPRLAFVIGNNDYEAIPQLKNPMNDAKLIAQSMRRLKFTVIEGYDLDLSEMQELFRDNSELIASAEAVVFYYAGHGFQLEGTNFLVPVDARFTSAADVPLQTVRLDAVIKLLENEERPTLVFLDACRDNPLSNSMQEEVSDGLAQIEAGLNTFIAFATEPGNVTNDGGGMNSPFALALAKHIETPGLSIADLTIAVRNETRALTLDRQSPWSQESLRAQFFFTERQQFDQQALILAAAEILQDPRQQAAFVEAQNEGLSFQAAVFRARQRGLEILGQPAPSTAQDLYEADPASSVEIASTAPAATATAAATTPEEGAEVLSKLMFTSLNPDGDAGAVAERERQDKLVRSLQTELQRLGCYRMAIDGDWGPGSRRALQNYLKNTNQTASSMEPSVELLNMASLSSGRICRAPVIIKRRETPKVARTSPQRRAAPTRQRQRASNPSFRQRAVKGKSRGAQRQRRAQRKRALPPDLSAGVGIGL